VADGLAGRALHWHTIARDVGWDEAPPIWRVIRRRRWFNRQRRIYWLEHRLGIAEASMFPPFWRDDL
jgi:hypothetical protein